MIFKLCFNFYMWIGVIKCLVEAKGDVVFNDPNILVMKDVDAICVHSTDRGDVSKVLEMCKRGSIDVFSYDSKSSKICKNADIYNIPQFVNKKGIYTVLHKRIFKDVSENVKFNVDFECLGDNITRQSQNLFDLLQNGELGGYVSLNLIGKEFEAKYCWTIGRSFKKDNNISLAKLKNLEPKRIKYKTMQCHTNGSIQPDDYNDVFYPGDIIPSNSD
ncbi:hypothetical protein TpMuguga_04g00038 [Theileria parva strain Muguga]|uniref:Uncharacterized protein n=1 Tax=Theileria parva TaxID=5875 RepID=Q4N3E9_THEPA|nr:uncharacterized protein TpMuguga_04g00038 [Theileria parva strain Muguga]EAN31390.1 hypothetical protein TpMuguga_04g00038 [Theileria parva strain Muguga]|eukprot:XP_763673.1 hypothetical protein [Theileria parva strain Muguga]